MELAGARAPSRHNLSVFFTGIEATKSFQNYDIINPEINVVLLHFGLF
jgi:hypothetical protein